jgi:hypothetical protein
MLTVLAGLAEFERELIRLRTSEGRDRANARRENGAPVQNDAAPDQGGATPPRFAHHDFPINLIIPAEAEPKQLTILSHPLIFSLVISMP